MSNLECCTDALKLCHDFNATTDIAGEFDSSRKMKYVDVVIVEKVQASLEIE